MKWVVSLATMMWPNNAVAAMPSLRSRPPSRVSSRSPTQARRALEREHNRYVAMVVASDIVDDALEWMLEGWHFGERESRYSRGGLRPIAQE